MDTTREKRQSVDSKILDAVLRRGRGSVFVPADFLHLGSREAVDTSLHRLVKDGVIRRLARGLYDYPETHPTLGSLQPSAETVARALAGRDRARLQPTGAYAANLLGLSDQVPAKAVFLTDGASRSIKIGETIVQLRQTTPRNMATAGRLSGLLIQALREIGQDQITPDRLSHLKNTIPASERKTLLEDIPLAPAWMHPIFRNLAE